VAFNSVLWESLFLSGERTVDAEEARRRDDDLMDVSIGEEGVYWGESNEKDGVFFFHGAGGCFLFGEVLLLSCNNRILPVLPCLSPYL